MLKCKVFTGGTDIGIEFEIEDWLDKERIDPTKVTHILQTQSSNFWGTTVVITVFYKP